MPPAVSSGYLSRSLICRASSADIPFMISRRRALDTCPRTSATSSLNISPTIPESRESCIDSKSRTCTSCGRFEMTSAVSVSGRLRSRSRIRASGSSRNSSAISRGWRFSAQGDRRVPPDFAHLKTPRSPYLQNRKDSFGDNGVPGAGISFAPILRSGYREPAQRVHATVPAKPKSPAVAPRERSGCGATFAGISTRVEERRPYRRRRRHPSLEIRKNRVRMAGGGRANHIVAP